MKPTRIKIISGDNSNSEIQWVEEIRQGHKDAFEELYHFYYPKLSQFAYRYVKSRTIAEDLVHDVFYNIWKKRKTLKANTLRAYLYTAVRNEAFKYLERRKVRNFVEFKDLTLVDADSYSPEENLCGKELRNAIVDAIDELPSRRRLVFLMHREDDLTYREIAEVLDISIKTVETQMSRSLKFLRYYLSEFISIIAVIISFLK